MSVDIFGDCDASGKKGPAGEDGEDSLDICHWFPLESLVWLRNTAQCCYYFDKDEDFKKGKDGKIVGFRSHSGRNDAISLKEPVKRLPFGRGYCAAFDNSLMEIPNTNLATDHNSFTFLVMTFKMIRIPVSEMIIVTDETLDRGLYVNLEKEEERFGIYGSVEEIFWKYKLKRWHTIAVQWTKKDDNKGYLYKDGKEAIFTTTPGSEKDLKSVFIGALKERKGLIPWNGCLAILEIYTYENLKSEKFPDKFRDLIIQDHKKRILRGS